MPILGILATIASLVISFVGVPAQIFKNFQRKSCDGLAPQLVYTACCSYTLWGLYGWTKPDIFLMVSQTPGCLLLYILLFQLYHYRKRI